MYICLHKNICTLKPPQNATIKSVIKGTIWHCYIKRRPHCTDLPIPCFWSAAHWRIWIIRKLSSSNTHNSSLHIHAYIHDADIDTSISSAELKLLNRVQSNEFHILWPLFPPLAQHEYSLRRGVHSFMLPCKDNKSFISRVLLKHCSQLV